MLEDYDDKVEKLLEILTLFETELEGFLGEIRKKLEEQKNEEKDARSFRLPDDL